MIKKFYDWLVWSSVDTNKVSATISGAIISVSSIILIIAAHYGVTLTAEQVAVSAGQLGTAVGSIIFIFGLIRKLVIYIWETSRK